MKKTIVAAALLSAFSTHAFAQTTTTEGNTPAVVAPDTKSAPVLVDGKNSFTEAQARGRIKDAGFSDVSALKLDDHGIWRGTATKGGKSVAVGIDYQGNVVAQ